MYRVQTQPIGKLHFALPWKASTKQETAEAVHVAQMCENQNQRHAQYRRHIPLYIPGSTGRQSSLNMQVQDRLCRLGIHEGRWQHMGSIEGS